MLAQNTSCDGSRYIDDLFTTSVTNGVKYGENFTYDNAFQELFVDIYEPVGDAAPMRPLVIFAFGGSFVAGNRGQMQSYCEDYARKGYVAASIDYRIYDGSLFPIPDSTKMLDVVVKAIGDMKAATRFFRKSADNGNPYRIDPNFIFVGGLSAGAITALHHAYIDDVNEVPANIAIAIVNNGGIEGDTDDPANSSVGYSSAVQGVINYSGALNRQTWIDSDDPPLFSAHGDGDGTVPYNYGFANIFGFPIVSMNGSGLLHPQASAVGVENCLITVPGGGHTDFYGDVVWRDSIVNKGSRFVEEIICREPLPLDLLSFNAEAMKSEVNLIWTTIMEVDVSYFVIEHSVDGIEFSTIGKELAKGGSSESHYKFMHFTPENKTNYYRLKMMDLDGSYSYSNIETVEFKYSEIQSVLSPNPFDGNFTINLKGYEGKVVFELYNSSGKLVIRENWQIDGYFSKSITAKRLTQGMYYYKIINDDRFVEGKLIKGRL